MKFLLPFALALGSFTAVAQIPAAITFDPPVSKGSPAWMDQLAIPSHGANMNGVIYVAEGAEQHPTVILADDGVIKMNHPSGTTIWQSIRRKPDSFREGVDFATIKDHFYLCHGIEGDGTEQLHDALRSAAKKIPRANLQAVGRKQRGVGAT